MTTATRKPGSERREEIAAAVLRIVGERGRTALTAATIAEEIGVTPGALFRHFASLDEILAETVRHAVARVESTFPDSSAPPLARLLELARRRVELFRAEPGLAWLLRSEQVYLTLPPEALAPLRDLVARSRAFLLAALEEGAARGEIRDDVEPGLLLPPVMGTIHVLAGLPGVHRSGAGSAPTPGRALAALARLLTPPSATTARPEVRRDPA